MSAKSDMKRNESTSDRKVTSDNDSTLMHKRNRINTSEKLSKKAEKYYDDPDDASDATSADRRVSEEKISYYADSKTTDKRQRSLTDSTLSPRNGTNRMTSPSASIASSFTFKHREIISDDSLDEIDEADREFESLLRRPNEGFVHF